MKFFNEDKEKVLSALGVTENGLSSAEAADRLEKNVLKRQKGSLSYAAFWNSSATR